MPNSFEKWTGPTDRKSSMSIVQQDPSSEAGSAVEEARKLEGAIADLHDRIDILTQKLCTTVTPEAPEPMYEGLTTIATRSVLTENLFSSTASVYSACSKLAALTARVEL